MINRINQALVTKSHQIVFHVPQFLHLQKVARTIRLFRFSGFEDKTFVLECVEKHVRVISPYPHLILVGKVIYLQKSKGGQLITI